MERRVLFGKAVLTAVVFAAVTDVADGASGAVSADTRTFTVKLQIDKPYCVLNFMETLRTSGYYGPTLYEHYKKSKYSQNEELAKLVQRYSGVRIKYRYHFDGYPKLLTPELSGRRLPDYLNRRCKKEKGHPCPGISVPAWPGRSVVARGW